MNNIYSINKRDLFYDEILPYKKNNLKTERDLNEYFPKINSKYYSLNNNQTESNLSNNTNLIAVRINKSENKNQNNKKNVSISKDKKKSKNKFVLNIKNIEIEDKKNNNNNYYATNNFQTLTDIYMSKILKKNKKNNLSLNVFKEKDSDIIPTSRNLENNFIISTKNKKIPDINISNNSVKKIDNIFKNIGINTKMSKTTLNFHPQKNNKVIHSYQTKEINIYNKNKEKRHKLLYSRNENISNNFRTIISSNDNKNIDYKMNHNMIKKTYNTNINNSNNKNNYKINNVLFNSLPNQIFRKIELSNQTNRKISDEYVQNLLNKEIEEIEKIKKIRYEINKEKNNGLFHNTRIKNQLHNINYDNYDINYNNKNQKNTNKEKLENNKNNIERDSIISKLKSLDLFTDIQMFDGNFVSNEELIKLYREYKKELLSDKKIILELGQYFVSLFAPKNKKIKDAPNKKNQDKIIASNSEENEKNAYNEEEKHIIHDIIYELSNDLNKNLELYKRNKNRNKTENSMNINKISLAKLLEKLNNARHIKRRSINNFLPTKTEENINTNHNDMKMDISFNENNNNISDEENEENKKLLNEILFNLLENQKPSDKEKKLNHILNNIKEGNDSLPHDDIKQILSNNQKRLNKEKTIIKNSNIKPNVNVINKKKNENTLSKGKKDTKKFDTNKNKKKTQDKNNGKKLKDTNTIKQSDSYLELKNNENDYDIKSENFNRNDLNDNIVIIQEESVLNKEREEDITSSDEEDGYYISKKKKKIKEKNSNILSNSQNREKSTKIIKRNKEVNFKEDNKRMPNDINIFNNECILLSHNDSFISTNSPRKKKRFIFSSMNSLENEENYGNNLNKNKIYMQFSPRKPGIIESLSRIKKRPFQKTRRDKTNRLINLRNEADIKKEQGIIQVDIREEMLNRKLRNFFGKINMLKNSNVNDYDEKLKTFIDGEIDKLNDWEAKEQEIRINNFFSDLKLMNKRFKIGSDIKYANPSSFSSSVNKS